jgi:2-polyprenyl-3-methyl-5-hydroxy-6-metoxy-1,4-benzoquinol methylase
MSEDTSAKRADRRRRTTRAGRRKPPRMPAGVAGDSWPPPSWPPEAGGDAALEGGGEGAAGEFDAADEALEGEDGLELEPLAEDEDSRSTVELHVTPLLTTPPPPAMDDEKTNPRVRLDEVERESERMARDSDSAPTHPQIKVAQLAGAQPDRTSSVVISRAQVISDAPPPPKVKIPPMPAAVAPPLPVEARDSVEARTQLPLTGGRLGIEPPPPSSGRLGVEPPPPVPGAFESEPLPDAMPALAASAPLATFESFEQTEPDAHTRWIEPAAREANEAPSAIEEVAASAATPSPAGEPPTLELELGDVPGITPQATAPEEARGEAPPAAERTAPQPEEPAAAAAAPALEAPAERAVGPGGDTELDDGGLQLVDVEDAEPDTGPRQSRVPPPPPPPAPNRVEAAGAISLPAPARADTGSRAKPPPPVTTRAAEPPAPKRPPPPPAPTVAKADEDRQKRKQVRQWWERFFSDDYLMTVLPPTPAQISRQVDFVEASLGLAKGATVLDVGCGLGLHSLELTRRGYLVVGLDLSLAMITRAAEASQEQGLKINFVHADIREMEFDGAFDGVICMGTTFGFFDDDANRDVLGRLHHALRPGGRLLLDLVNRDYVVGLQPNLVWFEGDDCVCMEESDFNYFNSRLTVKRTMMREDGRQSNAEYSLRLYSLHELGQLVQQLGFRVIEVSGQEAIRGAFFGAHSPRILMLAERRTQTRASTATHTEQGRPSLAFPADRNTGDPPKSPKPE